MKFYILIIVWTKLLGAGTTYTLVKEGYKTCVQGSINVLTENPKAVESAKCIIVIEEK